MTPRERARLRLPWVVSDQTEVYDAADNWVLTTYRDYGGRRVGVKLQEALRAAQIVETMNGLLDEPEEKP